MTAMPTAETTIRRTRRYRQTELGTVPEDWGVLALGDKTDRIGSGLTPTGGQRVYKDEGRPFVRSQNVGWGHLILDDLAFVDESTHASFSATEIKKGDVLLNITGASIGRCAVADERIAGGNVNQHVCEIRCKLGMLHPEFLKSFLLSRAGQQQIDAFQSGGNRQGLNFGQIRSFRIPCPDHDEQRAIAAALSDVDALIGALDKLIAKKRAIKLATMQQLLAGIRRLAGFAKTRMCEIPKVGRIPSDWNVAELRQVATMHGRIGWQGLKESEFTFNADDPFLITGMNFKDGEIRWDEVYHVPVARYAIAPQIQLKAGDVLMTKDGTIGKLLFVRSIPHPGLATLNSHLLVFRPKNDSFDPLFLYYQLSSRRFAEHVELHKSGSTFFGLTQAATGKYAMILPSFEEQRVIAGVLSDMDAEIAALERRRDKSKAIKLGMMQELLTGRTRLI